MIVIKKIIWDFSGTEFEDCDYEESRKIAILPSSLKIKEENFVTNKNIDIGPGTYNAYAKGFTNSTI